jgi:hypothetical protein
LAPIIPSHVFELLAFLPAGGVVRFRRSCFDKLMELLSKVSWAVRPVADSSGR